MWGTSLKKALREGRVVAGAFVKFPVTAIVETASNAGFDFVIIDWEHGAFDIGSIEHMIVAADAARIPAIVRVPALREEYVLHALDMGASGIMVPHIETREDAELAVRYAKYPPAGERGLGGGVRATQYGRTPLTEYPQIANESTLVMVQIETVKGVEAVDGIASVGGIDVLHTGPSDLSSSLGVPGQRDHPRVLEILSRICRSALSRGKAFGVPASVANLQQCVSMGATCLTFGADIDVLNSGYARIIEGLKQACANSNAVRQGD